MSKVLLISDTNLADIQFERDGQKVVFSFRSMSDGTLEFELVCDGVLFFKYNTLLECLPLYVGEVTQVTLVENNISQVLHGCGYSFEPSACRVFDGIKQLYLISIDGGEIEIQVAAVNIACSGTANVAPAE